MSYMIPSLRGKVTHGAVVQVATASPIAAPEILSATREAVCEMCGNNAGGRCRLFGCCDKKIEDAVKLALASCPAKYWTAWIPKN